ncbi:MAG: phosphocholine cytidylyltransferase family protein [Deltaproteobacteria bacterium]|nr:phosphocholine cytidylyltransferase family protein [Deltaproteobacteria bacterium]
MKAVLLAAGMATRLRPLTDDLPKCLLPVAGKPILRRAMDTLLACGIDEFALVTGFLEQKIRDAVGGWYPGLRVAWFTNPDYATTQNGPSLLAARPALDGRAFLMLDADIVFERGVIEAVLHAPWPNCLALRRARDLGEEEIKVELDGRGRVRRIDKPVPVAVAAGESIGIERFSAAASRVLFATLHERVVGRGLGNEWYEKSFEQMIERGEAEIHVVDVTASYCAEIDTPEDLAVADRVVRERECGAEHAP